MKNRDEIQQELEALSPLLAKLKTQEPPLDVPEHYFEGLPNQVWEQIKLQPAPARLERRPGIGKRFALALQPLLQPRLALSFAAFAMLIATGIYFLQVLASPTTASKELTATEISDYIENNLHEFDTELLINATAELSVQGVFSTEGLDEAEIDQIMEEIIEDLDATTLEEML